jgi:hypothetical protein
MTGSYVTSPGVPEAAVLTALSNLYAELAQGIKPSDAAKPALADQVWVYYQG